ncbi:hypothetical protein ACFYVL_17875 [Streptomyces sp. NPDC004111]|uniref:hypothetical protein n=1 Tax=Streptomyces sp. NPDC004111 TaxID=3364690 RepID=UPI0036AF1024
MDGGPRSLPLIGPTRSYGALVVEATRLAAEPQHTTYVLRRYVRRWQGRLSAVTWLVRGHNTERWGNWQLPKGS